MPIKPPLLRLSALLVLALTMPQQTAAFSLMPSEIPATKFASWQPMTEDFLVVDTEKNMGYLVHRDGGFTEFPVATGQRRVVRYIGRTYNAKTPNKVWTVLDKEVKSDRTTFGSQGLFLRLFDADGQTPYGIHTHRSITAMLAEEERFRSMGCVLVSQTVLDVIEATFEGNKRKLEVTTVAGFGDASVTYETLRQLVAVK